MVLDFTFLEQIDSTSSEAMRRIENGYPQPFAIAARSQTQGRGRRGKSWVSEGGIYFSLALLPKDIHRLLTLSLDVGVCMAMWLEQKFGLKTTLKWPNDLLFEGKKLGGILVESSVSGQQVRGVVIGVGINVRPIINDEDYPRNSLEEILDRSLMVKIQESMELTAKNCAEFILDQLQVNSDFLSKFSRFDTAQSLWINEGHFFCDLGVNPLTGNLNLKSLQTSEVIHLSSANHDYSWWVLSQYSNLSATFMIGDMGNSGLKLAEVDSSLATISLGRFATANDLWEARSRLNLNGKVMAVGVVGENHFQDFANTLQVMGAVVWKIKKKTIRVQLKQYDLKQIGIDRLALMEGYLKKEFSKSKIKSIQNAIESKSEEDKSHSHSQLTGAILVSAGTATTIDVILSNGEYLGGLIMPGVQTSLIAMHASTALLPLLDAKKILESKDNLGQKLEPHLLSSRTSVNASGKSFRFPWLHPSGTEDAMRAGVLMGLNGALVLMKQQLQEQYPGVSFNCLASGGFGPHVDGACINSDLIFIGLQVIAVG